MYLSCLLIDVGTNPDRPRPGRLWLRNLHHVHQRLCMAFPSKDRISHDPHFLKPFKPADFANNQVHVRRDGDSGFLFRIDPQPGGRVVILVQSNSAVKPDWGYAFHNARFLLNPLAAPPQVQEFDPRFEKGQRLRFRIRANLSKKIKTSTEGVDLTRTREGTDKRGRPKAQGKRVALTWDKDQNRDDVIRKWFAGKGGQGGFQVETFRVLQIGWGAGDRSDPRPTGGRMKFRSALLEGTLTVEDADSFRETIVGGVGHGKAFGFGLLPVAPLSL